MKQINGTKLPRLGFIPQKLGDLIYYEGPLLSLFIDNSNPDTYYLYKWVDNDDTANRWLITQLGAAILRSFFNKEISLRNLILQANNCFVVNINDDLAYKEVTFCTTNVIPKEYLPAENSFFSEARYTEFAQSFKTIIANNRIYDILDKILKEIDTVKKTQNDTRTLINLLLKVKNPNRITYPNNMLYPTQETNYETILY